NSASYSPWRVDGVPLSETRATPGDAGIGRAEVLLPTTRATRPSASTTADSTGGMNASRAEVYSHALLRITGEPLYRDRIAWLHEQVEALDETEVSVSPVTRLPCATGSITVSIL
ncbi:MAG: hypothetical protein OXG35_34115, partial [Acidobacteria bacterium]|nr:hypothetical protein [Acidobacteriota bacterium]